jgi:hypothetical protein
MKTTRKRRDTLVPLMIALVAASIALALVAGQARAADGGMSDMQGMSGMEGMSAEEMQNMATPAPAPSVTAVSGELAAAMDPNMDMGGGSANWLVVGGFVALIAGATLAAAATKRHLRRRMLAGELVGAGVQDV